jgi:hypothetical protein
MNVKEVLLFLGLLPVLLFSAPHRLSAHDVPNEVTVLTFIRPQGHTLTMLVRVPMKSLRDIDVPMREKGFLDIARADQALRDASQIWISDFVALYENGNRLAKPQIVGARVSLPSDRSFENYDLALAHIQSPPMPADTEIYWEQGMLDVAFAYHISSDLSDFSIAPGLTRLGVKVNVSLRFQQPDTPERAFDVHADVGDVHLDPSWLQAFMMFAKEGFFHILDGTDHLLFLFCLVLPFRQFRPLAVIVTAFTVAHSITLIASAFGYAPNALWFTPLIETLIAASILYMAVENIVGAKIDRRWIVTFGFGLVHGFGFSFLLTQRLQFAGDHLLTSLLAFNVGVEIGQLLVLAVALPVLALLFRHVVSERMGTIILSAFIAHTAWHWMIQRGEALSQFPWPSVDAAFMANALWWAMAATILAGILWLLSGMVRRWQEPAIASSSTLRPGRDEPWASPSSGAQQRQFRSLR